ncbi:MAG: patatin-like phospholipase family protein [Iodobacter sp.]
MTTEKFGPVTAEEYSAQTHDPIDRPAPEEKVFELGLVMAGAVSAGSYSAGVMDFLIEALDEWQAHEQDTTKHQIKLAAISGASAGSMVATIASAFLHQRFDHGPQSSNPLYQVWVNEVDISGLLETADLERADEKIPSVLDSSLLDRAAALCIRPWPAHWGNTEPQTINRPWLGAADGRPLRLIFTQTNLNGVPYRASLSGGSQSMTLHGDHIRFTLSAQTRRPDEYPLDPAKAHSADQNWHFLIRHALASGAFPVGLAHRQLERRSYDYCFRYEPCHAGPYHAIRLQPASLPLSGGQNYDYRYLSSDGGICNNEPFMLLHQELAGIGGSNQRNGSSACRAAIMIDPFPDQKDYKAPTGDEDMLDIIVPLLEAMKDQCRYSANELMLADQGNIYSRFLIAPSNSHGMDMPVNSPRALAAGGLGGFSGFLCAAFRHHDFMLGRYNCQQFLREHLSVAQGNPHVTGAASTSSAEVPLIPLHGSADQEQSRPVWPVDSISENQFIALADQMDERLRKLLRRSAHRQKIVPAWLLQLLLNWQRDKIVDTMMSVLHNDMYDAGLLSKGIAWRRPPPMRPHQA